MTDYHLSLTVEDGAEAALRVDDDIGLGLEIGDTYIRGEVQPYEGTYEATPTWDEQVFATSGKSMLADFEVHSIVKQEVSNEYGGITLSI